MPALLAAGSAGHPAVRVGERYRPRPGADEVVHKLDCVNGWPLSASAVREVHSVLSGAFKQALVWGWIAHNPVSGRCTIHRLRRGLAARRSRCRSTT